MANNGHLVATLAHLLYAALTSAYALLGFDVLNDDSFHAMVMARIVEPTSKGEVVQMLEEIGAQSVRVRTLFRSLASSQGHDYRGLLASAARAQSVTTAGTAALVLYDVTAPFRAG